MKIACMAFLLFLPSTGFAQPSGAGDCEDLVFNTRELIQFAYNTRCKTESYPFLSPDGNHLYFTNNQVKNWVFYSKFDTISRIWSVPVPLVIDNYQGDIISCFVSDDLNEFYFTNSQKALFISYRRENSNTHFSEPESIQVQNQLSLTDKKTGLFSYLSFTPDKNYMYAYTGSPGQSGTQSMGVYQKSGERNYIFKEYLSKTDKEMGCITDGGLLYYFTNETQRNVLFFRKRNNLSESFSEEIFIAKIFESNLDINHVRVSNNHQRLVLVLSESVWAKNDIYFLEDFKHDSGAVLWNGLAVKAGNPTPVLELKPVLISEKEYSNLRQTEIISKNGNGVIRIDIGQAFPNPARNIFFVYYCISGEILANVNPVLSILDQSGRNLFTQKLDEYCGEAKVNPERVPSGTYYLRIEYNGVFSPLCKITLTF